MAQKHYRKYQPTEQGAQTLQTERRQTDLRQQVPNVTQSHTGKNENWLLTAVFTTATVRVLSLTIEIFANYYDNFQRNGGQAVTTAIFGVANFMMDRLPMQFISVQNVKFLSVPDAVLIYGEVSVTGHEFYSVMYFEQVWTSCYLSNRRQIWPRLQTIYNSAMELSFV